MKMVKTVTTAFLSFLLVFCFASGLKAQNGERQESKQEIKVKKRTIMEEYEPDMVISAQDRIQLKKDRIATIRKRRKIIDTLDISDRKRRKLLKELYSTPFSDKWEKVIADLEFEGDEY